MYLMVAGGILFTLEVLILLALLPCVLDESSSCADDKIVAGMMPLRALAMFAVTIWGSVVVFGKSNEYVTLLRKMKNF